MIRVHNNDSRVRPLDKSITMERITVQEIKLTKVIYHNIFSMNMWIGGICDDINCLPVGVGVMSLLAKHFLNKK